MYLLSKLLLSIIQLHHDTPCLLCHVMACIATCRGLHVCCLNSKNNFVPFAAEGAGLFTIVPCFVHNIQLWFQELMGRHFVLTQELALVLLGHQET